MRISMDSDEKKAHDGVVLNDHDGESSQERPIEEQEKGPVDVGTAPDEEKQDGHSVAESQLPPPPDGGLHAWLKVFGGFLIYINIWFVLSLPQCSRQPKLTSFKGLHALIRRLSIVLLVYATPQLQPIRHLVDRHRASVATHFHRRTLWAALRHGVLP
jgi:hypothetical protein